MLIRVNLSHTLNTESSIEVTIPGTVIVAIPLISENVELPIPGIHPSLKTS